METLLVDPPFTKEEWLNITVSEIMKDEKFINYFNTYSKAVYFSEKGRINKILNQNNEELFDLKKLISTVDKYTSDQSHGLIFFENLLHLVTFTEILKRKFGIKFNEVMEEKITTLHIRAVLELIHWCNFYYDITEEAPV